MAEKKQPANSKPAIDADVKPTDDENDTEGHSLLNAQFGAVIANERAREAARWGKAEQARKEQNRRKDGRK